MGGMPTSLATLQQHLAAAETARLQILQDGIASITLGEFSAQPLNLKQLNALILDLNRQIAVLDGALGPQRVRIRRPVA